MNPQAVGSYRTMENVNAQGTLRAESSATAEARVGAQSERQHAQVNAQAPTVDAVMVELERQMRKAAQLEAELSTLRAGKKKVKEFSGDKFDVGQNWEKFEMRFNTAVKLAVNTFFGWTEEEKCAYLLSALKGKAWDLAAAYIRRMEVEGGTYNDLLEELRKTYVDKAATQRALEKIQKIKQKGSVHDYNADFRLLTNELSTLRLEEQLIQRYYLKGLSRDLALQIWGKRPKSVSTLR